MAESGRVLEACAASGQATNGRALATGQAGRTRAFGRPTPACARAHRTPASSLDALRDVYAGVARVVEELVVRGVEAFVVGDDVGPEAWDSHVDDAREHLVRLFDAAVVALTDR